MSRPVLAFRRRLAPLLCLVLVAATKPPPPLGELALDADDPVVTVVLAGVPLRLRVDLSVQDMVELNPAAAARLPLAWEPDVPLEVGRVRLAGRVALATLGLADGRTVPVQVSDHGRDCCAGVDGAVPPGILPFAAIRWTRPAAPAPTATRVLPLGFRPDHGYEAESGVPGVRIRFDPFRADSLATAAAGARLAKAWGGRWAGAQERRVVAFGIARPVRPIAFDRPGRLAGFDPPALAVRLVDFAGHGRLPQDPATPGEIVVKGRTDPQHAWPVVTLGGDVLGLCREIMFTPQPLLLTLRCAFPR